MNKRTVFPLRMSLKLREKIRDRASDEDRTQTDLIKDAIEVYLLKPISSKTTGYS